jgi:hypothetical protein
MYTEHGCVATRVSQAGVQSSQACMLARGVNESLFPLHVVLVSIMQFVLT